LNRYSYAHGNARELRAEIHQAIGKAMLEDDNVLRAGYLSEKLRAAMVPPRTYAEHCGSESAGVAETTGLSDELLELAALRRHSFQIKPAEEELGLSHKSRTLSNHLRGMCIKALSENDWNLQRAARWLCASEDSRIINRVEGKMRRFLKNIEDNAARHAERKLYNNLPSAYHESLAKAIRWVRSRHREA
jgi:transcriptional regulator with GAF, ATPase, and Fis domain